MELTTIKVFSTKNLLNIFFCFLPVSFIAGNLAINLNLLLIIILSSIFYGKNIISSKFFLIDRLIIFFFLFTFIVGLFNSLNVYDAGTNFKDNLILKKSIFFFKYLFFYFCIKTLVEKDILNFKFFFLSCGVCVIFVSLDLVYQLIFNKDIFGFERIDHKLSGPFGEEQIAGGYLQKFSFFVFFLFFILDRKLEKKTLSAILVGLFMIISFSVLISGNRMPIVMYLLSWFFLFLLEKDIRKYFIIFLILTLIFVIFIFWNVEQVKMNILNFYSMLSQIFNFLPQLFGANETLNFPNTYIKELYSGYATWKTNIIFGGGIESFHINCSKILNSCSSHPHNYYLEILSETGLIGLVSVCLIFLYIFYISIVKKFILNTHFQNNYLISPFAIMFLIEIFPIKTSGSFFTTGNATYLFFIMAVIVGLYRRPHLN